jgi:hypothetical protein
MVKPGEIVLTVNINSCHRIHWGIVANVRGAEVDIDGAPPGAYHGTFDKDPLVFRTPPGYRSSHHAEDTFATIPDAKRALARRLRREAHRVERTI